MPIQNPSIYKSFRKSGQNCKPDNKKASKQIDELQKVQQPQKQNSTKTFF